MCIMDKEKFRTYRVYLLAAALIMLWPEKNQSR